LLRRSRGRVGGYEREFGTMLRSNKEAVRFDPRAWKPVPIDRRDS
jgi:hypothetical protein